MVSNRSWSSNNNTAVTAAALVTNGGGGGVTGGSSSSSSNNNNNNNSNGSRNNSSARLRYPAAPGSLALPLSHSQMPRGSKLPGTPGTAALWRPPVLIKCVGTLTASSAESCISS